MRAVLSRRAALAGSALAMLTACAGEPDAVCVQGPTEETAGDAVGGGAQDAEPLAGTMLSELGLALSPDGSRLAANQAPDRRRLGLSETSGTTVWDTGSGEVLTRLDNGLTGALAWHPDGELVAIGGSTVIHLSDPAGEVQWRLSGHGEPRSGPARIRDLGFSPDGRMLATLGSDGAVRLWSTALGECAPARMLQVRGVDPRSLSWSPDGGTLAVAGPGGAVELWDPVSGKRRSRLTGIDGSPHGVAYDEDGSLLIGTGEPGGLFVVGADDDTGDSASAGPQPLSRRPRSIAVGTAGRVAVGGEQDNQVMVWDRGSDERSDLPRVAGSVGRLRWSPDGEVLYGASRGEGVVRWEGGDWQALEAP